MDRLDNNIFRSLLNEATNILNRKNETSEYTSLEEAIQNGNLTEEEASQINQIIFENTILIPNIEKLIEDIENYTGEELTEEQLNEILGGLSSLTGAALGGLKRLGGKAIRAAGRAVGKVADVYATGERARGQSKAETADKVLSSPTARGKLGAILGGQGSGVGSAFMAGVDHGPSVERKKILDAAKSGDAAAAEKLRQKFKGMGFTGKKLQVNIDKRTGKYRVTDESGEEHIIEYYVFSKQNGELILESIIRN